MPGKYIWNVFLRNANISKLAQEKSQTLGRVLAIIKGI